MLRTVTDVRSVRSIFVSDVHLGCRHAKAHAFADFLDRHDADYIYLVGDIIDGWRLRKRWYWQPVYNRIFRRLLEMADRGTHVCYAPGNHDSFLRSFIDNIALETVEIADEFIHEAADERRYLITHGDLFDDVEIRAQWLSMLGAYGYDLLMYLNGWMNRLRQLVGLEACCFTKSIKSRVKLAVNFVSKFETRLVEHARANDCDGVICGHVHTPTVIEMDSINYFNTGDWVENCSALLEYHDGRMEIVNPATTPEKLLAPAIQERELGVATRQIA